MSLIYTKHLGEPPDTAVVDVEYIVTDMGIGPYEYWGARGTHVDMQPEILEVWINGEPNQGELPPELEASDAFWKELMDHYYDTRGPEPDICEPSDD